jgi:iron complex transport system substrate-binding protein
VQGLAPRLVALAAAAVLLAGCEANKNPPEEITHLKVAHANGETIVPPRAKRVVALAPDALDTAVALGVPPTGAALPAGHRRLPRYLGAAVADTVLVGPTAHVDLAKINELDPDLILGTKPVQGRIYGKLKDVAATVTSESVGHADWELNTRLYSEAMGRQAAGERLLRDYDHRIARLKRVTGPRRGEREVSMVRVVPGAVRVYNSGSYAGSILKDGGIGRAAVQDAPQPYFVVAARDFAKLDGDLILLSRAPGSGATYRKLVSSPRWQGLRGVRTGKVRPVNDDAWYVGNGIFSARRVIADLERLLPRG